MTEKEKYLDILIKKENEAEYNHRQAIKEEKQTKALYMASKRERMAFEEGLSK